MKARRNILIATVVLVVGIFAAGCGLYPQNPEVSNKDTGNPFHGNNTNKDPRSGWVLVKNDDANVAKICDGPNLIYKFYNNPGVVSPNDPQCKDNS